MAAVKRIIQKPPGLTLDQNGQFLAALSAALRAQRRLAESCKYVLRPESEIVDSETHWSYEHEPANPLRPAELFLPSGALISAPSLLAASYALFEALRSAHATGGPGPLVHGAICPGVILIADDGDWKVADFGVLQALASVVGMEVALNLAVGPPPPSAGDAAVSGAWCLLPPEEFDRDDRICAFIDPEKYAQRLERGGRMPRDFGPKCDIVAAGFVLHLLAEHHHPYFYDLESAHRIPEMAEMVAGRVPTQARRRDLRESELPGMREWCAIMPRVLSHISEHRPSAAEVTTLLAPFVGVVIESPPGAVTKDQVVEGFQRLGDEHSRVRERILAPADPGRESDAIPPPAPTGGRFRAARAFVATVLDNRYVRDLPLGAIKIAQRVRRIFRSAIHGKRRVAIGAVLLLVVGFAGYATFVRPVGARKDSRTSERPVGERKDSRTSDLQPVGERKDSRTSGENKTLDPAPVQRFTLTLEQKGQGQVDPPPGTSSFEAGKEIELAGTPAEGWRFDRWEGDVKRRTFASPTAEAMGHPAGEGAATGTVARIRVVMDADMTITAIFVQQFKLKCDPLGQGKLTRNPDQVMYEKGVRVALTAEAAPGWRFDRWEGDATGTEARIRVVMNGDKTVKAIFVQQFALATIVEPPGPDPGTVSLDPQKVKYDKGEMVSLTARAAEGWRFDRWVEGDRGGSWPEGESTGRKPQTNITMDGDRTVRAVFMQSGWTPFNQEEEKGIKDLLANKSPLTDCAADWIRLDAGGGTLSATIVYPWTRQKWVAIKPLTVEVPFPGDTWPPGRAEQLAKTADAIAQELGNRAGSDSQVNAALQYLAFWKRREQLEEDLLKKPPSGSGGPVSLSSDEMAGYLTRLARIKWMSGDIEKIASIEKWTEQLQAGLSGNRGQESAIKVRPTRFIEYFWGPRFTHALYWFADVEGDQGGSPKGPPAFRYVRLGGWEELGQLVSDLIAKQAPDAGAGEQLLGPILRDKGEPGRELTFFQVTDPRKSFGMVLAPDGPLCFLPLLSLPFQPISVRMEVPDTVDPLIAPRSLKSISRLAALFSDGPGKDEKLVTASTAAWIMVSLGPARATLQAPQPRAPCEVPWEIPCAMLQPDRKLARTVSINEFGKAFNGDVVCFSNDSMRVREALKLSFREVNRQFNPRGGEEPFDAGFIGPRLRAGGDAQSLWFSVVAHPVLAR